MMTIFEVSSVSFLIAFVLASILERSLGVIYSDLCNALARVLYMNDKVAA
jgi:hypothetical protein